METSISQDTYSWVDLADLTGNQLVAIYGRNIEVHMARLGLNATQLGEKIGTSGETVSRMKKNPRGRFIDPEYHVKLARLFGCSLEDMLTPQPGVKYPTLEKLYG